MATDTTSTTGKIRNGRSSFKLTRETTLLIMTLLLIIIASFVFSASFPSFTNAAGIMRNFALDAIMVCGMMVLMVSGVFDLSVGSIYSLVGVLTAALMKNMGWPVALAVLAGLAAGVLCGLVNGFVTARIKVNALITTLGTQQIFRGIAIWIGGTNIPNLPQGFNSIAQSKFLGIQGFVWIMVVVVLITYLLLSQTRFFRQFYYIGGNIKAAKLSGINVPRMQMFGFAFMGLMAGLAGMLFASRLGAAVAIAGDGKELAIITATILGGASLSGGKGNVLGALIGVIFIAVVNNLMILATVEAYWQSIVIGSILILAVATDWLVNRGK
jgi:ribose transport system permease protein